MTVRNDLKVARTAMAFSTTLKSKISSVSLARAYFKLQFISSTLIRVKCVNPLFV